MIAALSIIERLREQVADLQSVDGAAELAAVLGAGPQVHARPRAFVVPLGLRGLEVQSFSGSYVQEIEVTFGVYLVFNAAADRTGARTLADVGTVQFAVIAALCGWTPAGSEVAGDFRLARAQLADLRPGQVAYALEFSAKDQLRFP
ncbi:phage tail terminator protein [Tabrizicola fusiformis]|uniref:phage tail terminator protein n=1 Tax=Tabrizicola sp. SY72 TaxID=2741673 RepID=UPI001571C1C5|nr:hypothetical protein [Tabrizicola sp. SY72]NTT86920.1 hypothetical protein [Tabrizicola sp. SY72]